MIKSLKNQLSEKQQKRRWGPLNIQDVWWVMVGAISRKVARKWVPKKGQKWGIFHDFSTLKVKKNSKS